MDLLRYAKLCQQSYDGGLDFIEVEDLCFGIIHSEGSTVIVFRGSANLENWLRDFSVFPARSQEGYLAHAGFVKAFNVLWPVLLNHIPKDRPIVTTGHSLGGALAVLCAERLGCRAITFGCPRVYFWLTGMPKLYHTRIVCDDDPVTKVPHFLFKVPFAETRVLSDQDGELINPEDHRLGHYIKRLEISL